MTYFIDREVTEFLFDLNQIQGSADCANIHSGRGVPFGAGPGGIIHVGSKP